MRKVSNGLFDESDVIPFLFIFRTSIANYRPVVLWHGMGDSCCNPDSMGKIQELINETLPGTYTYSIMLGKDEGEDKKA
ncbi:12620_t:CDS:1, partial [Acaulospora morrowiae]